MLSRLCWRYTPSVRGLSTLGTGLERVKEGGGILAEYATGAQWGGNFEFKGCLEKTGDRLTLLPPIQQDLNDLNDYNATS